jgi:predicted enzyme related to lactoylglutathione lyase
MSKQLFLGLRTVIYHAPDLDRAKAWYTDAFGVKPYFDEPFYVGFNIGGYELGLTPDAAEAERGIGGSTTYWGVEDAHSVLAHLLEHGAAEHSGVQDVGDGILVASVRDPFGNVIGVIQNPHFKAE